MGAFYILWWNTAIDIAANLQKVRSLCFIETVLFFKHDPNLKIRTSICPDADSCPGQDDKLDG